MPNALTKKYGPLEGWQWLVIGGGGAALFYYYKKHSEEGGEGISPEAEEKLLGALSKQPREEGGGGVGSGGGGGYYVNPPTEGGGSASPVAPEVNLTPITEGLTHIGEQQRESETRAVEREKGLREGIAGEIGGFGGRLGEVEKGAIEAAAERATNAAELNRIQEELNNPPTASPTGANGAATHTNLAGSGLQRVTNPANAKYGNTYKTVNNHGVKERQYYRNGKPTVKAPVTFFTKSNKPTGQKKPAPIHARVGVGNAKQQPKKSVASPTHKAAQPKAPAKKVVVPRPKPQPKVKPPTKHKVKA